MNDNHMKYPFEGSLKIFPVIEEKPVKVVHWFLVKRGSVNRHAQISLNRIGNFMKTSFYIVLIICVAGMVICAGCTNRPTSPAPVTTKIITSAPQQQDNSWITATEDNDNIEVPVGGIWTITGKVSGTNGPITYTIHTIEDIRDKKNFNNPLVTKSFSPSADGTFTLNVEIDPKILPVGSYVVYLEIPNGQSARLQFLVRANGVDCIKLCDQVSSSQSYTEGLQYNGNGEAVCYC